MAVLLIMEVERVQTAQLPRAFSVCVCVCLCKHLYVLHVRRVCVVFNGFVEVVAEIRAALFM